VVLGQTPNILADEPDPFTLPSFEPVGVSAPLQSGIVAEPLFSPVGNFAFNAALIGGAILLGILVMRGLRK
jgi:hypothetical protein